MALDYAAATKARDAYSEQAGRFESEATAYRDRAALASSIERHSCLDAARTLDAQAAQVRKLADDMQQQMNDARQLDRSLSFEETMAAARERGKRLSRGDEGNELG